MENLRETAITCVNLYVLIVLQYLAAYQNNFLTVTQMNRRGIRQGLPLLYHFGILADVLFLTPLIGRTAYECADEWPGIGMLTLLGFGFFVSLFMHITIYRRGTVAEAHVIHGKLTYAGWIHFMYMGLAITCFLLFFFYSASDHQTLLILITCYLPVHFFIGTHMLLGLFKPAWFPKRPIKELGAWLTVIIPSLFAGIICIGKMRHWF